MRLFTRAMLPLLMVAAFSQAVVAGGEDAARQAIRQRIESLPQDIEVKAVEPTSIDGLYQVDIGRDLVYMTSDGRYLLRGELLDLAEGRNLTRETQRRAAASSLQALSSDELIIYEPQGEVRFEVTVFTDIECPYCRRFHRQLDAYLKRGIRIRYAFMPRGGRNSKSYAKAVAVWCADDPHQAMTRAKRGESVPRSDCDHPVAEHLQLANKLGLRGTPSILTNDGRELGGYVTPAELVDALEDR